MSVYLCKMINLLYLATSEAIGLDFLSKWPSCTVRIQYCISVVTPLPSLAS